MKTAIKRIYRRLVAFFKKLFLFLKPSATAMRGASYGVLVVFALILISMGLPYLPHVGFTTVFLIVLLTATLAVLTGLLANLLLKLLSKIPAFFRFALFAALPLALFSFMKSSQAGFSMYAYFVVFSAFAGGALWVILRKELKLTKPGKKILTLALGVAGLAGLITVTYWLVQPGSEVEMPEIAALKGEYMPAQIESDDPGTKGTYKVSFLSYGSGKDLSRSEYAEDVAIKTTPVDGSFFVDGWEGLSGKLRSRHFGFELDSLPRNAMVWYPEGEGPFPLALIVHGNHLAQKYSDPGYDYLGELLASRGIILASVDQNFLNGSITNLPPGLRSENDARGWLLLEHLKLWEEWNNDSTSIFFDKVDMDNISLIGHSRGGEAVAHAALFNNLPFYPDDGNVKFDYNFNIRSIAAIAPCDGQYQPSGSLTTVEDVSYLVLHGSHDADVQSYMGMRQYERIRFTDDFEGFKAGLYIYRANHGQFNTRWGRKDAPNPMINLINTRQLMPAEDQQKISKIFISAFLEVTLKGKKEYLPLFKDYRTGINWLPETVYLNRFDKSGMQYICRYTEDFDLTITTLEGGFIEAENLTVWREQMVDMKWGNKGTRAAFIGWNNKENDPLIACYSINFPKESINTSENSILFFSLADTNENSNPNPKDDENDLAKDDAVAEISNKNNNAGDSDDNEPGSNGQNDGREPVDFSIMLTDSNGETITFKLSDHAYLQPPVQSKMAKMSFMETLPQSEHIYNFFHFPINRFADKNEKFSAEKIIEISFIFDQTDAGVIILDHLGFL